MSGRVYSYLRFSSAKQAAGASAVRQTDYAKKWADDNGMVLDESLSMRDEGLSAYHGAHLKKGALGVFLKAATDGKIPPGSVLVVEGLDRLSRADPLDAQAQLASIINAGVSVVTAADNKTYSRETLKANPTDLLHAMLIMMRANEESGTKSKRVGDALDRKCKGWLAGTYRGKISCGNVPSWVQWNGERYELIPDKAEAIRYAIRLYIAGYGAVKILQEFAAKGISVTGEGFAENLLQLLKQPDAFIGNRKLTVGGTEYLLEGYYPRLIDDAEQARLKTALDKRKRGKNPANGKSKHPGLFTGTQLGVCAHCGTGLTTQNLTRTTEDRYKENRLYRRIRCVKCTNERAKHKLGGRFCIADPVEKAILDFCSDQLNLSAIFATNQLNAQLQEQYALDTGRVIELEQQQAKIVDAALASPEGLPAVLVAKLRQIETDLAKARAALDLSRATLKSMEATPDAAQAERWRELRDAVLALDYDARIKCRQLLTEAFTRISLNFEAANPTTGAPAVGVELTSKTGERRLLIVDRKSGETVFAGQFEALETPPAVRAVKARILQPAG